MNNSNDFRSQIIKWNPADLTAYIFILAVSPLTNMGTKINTMITILHLSHHSAASIIQTECIPPCRSEFGVGRKLTTIFLVVLVRRHIVWMRHFTALVGSTEGSHLWNFHTASLYTEPTWNLSLPLTRQRRICNRTKQEKDSYLLYSQHWVTLSAALGSSVMFTLKVTSVYTDV